MGCVESMFPWPVSPIQIDEEKDSNTNEDSTEKGSKDQNLIINTRSNIDQDLEFFEKYLKIAIKNELSKSSALDIEDNHDEIEAIKNQAMEEIAEKQKKLKESLEKKSDNNDSKNPQ